VRCGILHFALCILLAALSAACDSVARATAAPATVVVNLPPSGGPTAGPAIPTPPAPPADAPNSSGATDVDDTGNDPDPRELPPADTGDTPDTSCEQPGRGGGTGAPGNGKGQGDEHGNGCR
jgi:hypothetical protein